MLFLRSLAFNILFYSFLTCILLLGLPALMFHRKYVFTVARIWCDGSLWLLKHIVGLDVEFRGTENIPTGPCIIAPKHQSVWETFALLRFFSDFTFILKRELTWIPLFGLYVLKAEQIAINRTKGREALAEVAEKSKATLSQGRQIFIFPEGTRRAAGAEPNYKFGVAYLYAQNQVPCLPVALNSGLFWPRRKFLKRPGKVLVEFLPTIPAGLPRDVFLATLQDKIESSTNRLIEESLSDYPELKHR